ncbi:PREDICTED: uncharacterized protein LOC105584860 isoform X2 [Cercocebus atys]|uniref:uncharacterized protein LOC105584860 isoform X2 n=1 Tax=Cercocebus atys TaxID=9531 RepID=UPI0005F51212|nr:PREDICTED: uncharacterized protein LOC105584860 isoform X2 [Cercocebus atys]
MGPDPGICPWIPIRLGCRQLPKASSAFSHAAILAPGTAAGSLHAPRKTLQTRPAHFSCPGGSRRPGSSWAPEPRMGCCLQSQLPQVSFQRARRLLQVCSAGQAAARRVLGGGRRGARAEGGEGKDAGAGDVVGGGTVRGRSRSARPRRYLSPNNVATRGEHGYFWGFGGNRERAGGGRGPHRSVFLYLDYAES